MNINQVENETAPPQISLTLNDLAKIMNDNKLEIISKVDKVAKDVGEVKSDVDELKDKFKCQEKINEGVNERIKRLEIQISKLSSEKPLLNTDDQAASVADRNNSASNDKDQRIANIISQGKRVIGLCPIDQSDLETEKEHFQNEQDVMISAAYTFFIEDMSIPKSTLDKMKIIRAFRPATSAESDKLYVEFESEISANVVRRYRTNLAPGVRIFPWFSPALYERYKALEEEAYQLRKVKSPSHQTNIRYEVNDIALYKRLDRNHRWTKVEVSGLPNIVLDPDFLVKPSGGASGRRRLNSKRKRNSSNDDVETNKTLIFFLLMYCKSLKNHRNKSC